MNLTTTQSVTEMRVISSLKHVVSGQELRKWDESKNCYLELNQISFNFANDFLNYENMILNQNKTSKITYQVKSKTVTKTQLLEA